MDKEIIPPHKTSQQAEGPIRKFFSVLGPDGVIAALKSPQPFQAGVLQAPPPVTAVAAAVAPAPETQPLEAEKPVVQQKGKPEKITIGATMNFGSFSQWMEAQKRLATINPPLSIEISSLTKDSVRFTIAYDGGLEAFRTALAGKGLALNQPVVEVDEAVLGSDKPTQKTVYELSLLN